MLDVIYNDFQKASDAIDHFEMLCKLSCLGFCRSVFVLLTSGVPQGLNLGSLSFLLVIYDIASIKSCC